MEPRLAPPQGGFATRAVAAAILGPTTEQQPLAPAVHPASTWAADRSADLGDLLDDRADGYVYGRYDNPTATVVHTVVASLHGADAAWSFASGTAAILATLDTLRGTGRLLVTRRLYGGTWALLDRLARRDGWPVDHADLDDPDAVAEQLTDDHTVVYTETVANPSTAVADLPRLAEVCRDAGVALVVDNTFASPYLCRPLELGATAVVESATKFLGGHGDLVGGVVASDEATIRAIRVAAYELGAPLGPFEAFLLQRGLQTLHLRVRESSRNALAVAETLEQEAIVDVVRYPGLDSHPDHVLADALFGGRGFGGVLSFDLGDRDRAEAFADACQVFARAPSLGATHSLVLHPASTSHRQLTDADLDAAGVGPGTVRLSVGVEDATDLIADCRRALAVAATRP